MTNGQVLKIYLSIFFCWLPLAWVAALAVLAPAELAAIGRWALNFTEWPDPFSNLLYGLSHFLPSALGWRWPASWALAVVGAWGLAELLEWQSRRRSVKAGAPK